MSTDKDVEVLLRHINVLNPHPRSILYVGCGDRRALGKTTRAVHPTEVTTLDSDRELFPSIVWDLNETMDLPVGARRDLAVVSNVCMYLLDPIGAIMRLRRTCRIVMIQDNVVRDRPDADPWPDRNRFVCSQADASIREWAMRAKGDRNLIDLTGLLPGQAEYYPNGDGCISALWYF